MSTSKKKGLTLVEVVVGVSIVTVFFMVLAQVFNLYLTTALNGQKSVKASFLAEEGVESMKFLRKVSWKANVAPMATNTPFYVNWNNGTGSWATTTQIANTYIDGFERSLVFSDVNRDASYNIVTSGGTLDLNSKMLVVTVSWANRNATSSKSVKTYLMNLYDN